MGRLLHLLQAFDQLVATQLEQLGKLQLHLRFAARASQFNGGIVGVGKGDGVEAVAKARQVEHPVRHTGFFKQRHIALATALQFLTGSYRGADITQNPDDAVDLVVAVQRVVVLFQHAGFFTHHHRQGSPLILQGFQFPNAQTVGPQCAWVWPNLFQWLVQPAAVAAI